METIAIIVIVVWYCMLANMKAAMSLKSSPNFLSQFGVKD